MSPRPSSSLRLGQDQPTCVLLTASFPTSLPEFMASSRPSAPKARTRTFTGCLTCRSRKVKCGGQRPQCHNCVRLGYKCRGYEAQLQWLPIWDPDQPASTSPDKADSRNEHRRTRTQILDAYSTSRFLHDLSLNASAAGVPYTIDDILQQLDNEATETARSRHGSGWQLSQGPFAVLNFAAASSGGKFTSIWQPSEVPDFSTPSVDTGSDSMAWLDSLDWPLSIADGNIGSPSLFGGIFADPDSGYPVVGTEYAPLIPDERTPQDCRNFTRNVTSIELATTQSTSSEDGLHPLQKVTDNAAYGHLSLSTSSLSNSSPYIPSNVRFLLSHYVTHVIESLSGLPQTEAPWKQIHVPYAMTAYGELDIMGRSSYARVSLLYSLLALTCYHLGTLYRPTSTTPAAQGQELVTDEQVSNSQYWNAQGLKFREIARTAFRKCRHAMAMNPAEPTKYKELFVSAMSLICTGIISGDPWDSRLFILQCEDIVKKTGQKKGAFSSKALQLHRIFAYVKIIEQTTFVQTKAQYVELLEQKAVTPEEVELVQQVPSTPSSFSSTLTSVFDTWSDLGLDGPEEETFDEFYGMPGSILRLIARTNEIVTRLEVPQLSSALAQATSTLEGDICGWHKKHKKPSHSGGPLNQVSSISISNLLNPTETLKSHYATAMHHALMVYFFRSVRDTNPIILQHYVESILDNLEKHHQSKQCFFPGARLGVTVWPGFIAACEALGDELRQRAIMCLRHAAWAGFQNGEAAESVAREVWRRRDDGESNVSWRIVIRESRTILLLT